MQVYERKLPQVLSLVRLLPLRCLTPLKSTFCGGKWTACCMCWLGLADCSCKHPDPLRQKAGVSSRAGSSSSAAGEGDHRPCSRWKMLF